MHYLLNNIIKCKLFNVKLCSLLIIRKHKMHKARDLKSRFISINTFNVDKYSYNI